MLYPLSIVLVVCVYLLLTPYIGFSSIIMFLLVLSTILSLVVIDVVGSLIERSIRKKYRFINGS